MTFVKNMAIIVCERVSSGEPVLHVSHDIDGDWQFLCGSDNHNNEQEKGLVWCIGDLLEIDSTLAELEVLPTGWRADRKTIKETWVKSETKQ